jgi:hypothetical protein
MTMTRLPQAAGSVSAPTTWVLSNHGVVRRASRFGLPVGTKCPNGIGVGDPQPDAALGLRRAHGHRPDACPAWLVLPVPGRGLGLPDSTDMPDDARQSRRGPEAGTPSEVGTAAGCPCHGKATGRHTGSAPQNGPGSHCRGPKLHWPSTAKRAWRAQPSSCIARCWQPVASMGRRWFTELVGERSRGSPGLRERAGRRAADRGDAGLGAGAGGGVDPEGSRVGPSSADWPEGLGAVWCKGEVPGEPAAAAAAAHRAGWEVGALDRVGEHGRATWRRARPACSRVAGETGLSR